MFTKSWLTTIIGILGAMIQLLTAYSSTGSVSPAEVTAALSTLAIGLGAKSFNVSGNK
jgi:hypothetical protein